MYAWHLPESPGQYEYGEVPDPVPGPDEVRIRVRATALNHMDLWLTTGLPKPPRFPHVPGNDVAGVIESVGSAVVDWEPGDEVVANTAVVPAEALKMGIDSVLHPAMALLGEACWGGHGELCVVPAHGIVAKPADRSWVDCAAYPVCYSTAWRLLRRARITNGDTVLVTGIGGGVATAALHDGQPPVGARVFVTSRDEAKRRRAIELGAADAFDSGESYPITADIVVDSIGPATWDYVAADAPQRRSHVRVRWHVGTEVELNLPRLFFKQLDIIGASCGSQLEFEYVTEMVAGGLPIVVDDVYPLSDYPIASGALRTGSQFGKLVLEHPI